MRSMILAAALWAGLSAGAAVEVVNSDFEQGNRGWTLPRGYGIRPREGRNASCGLHVKRGNVAENTGWASQKLRLEPGTSYRVSCHVKANITRKGKYKVGASFVLTFRNDKKVLGRIYQNGLIASSDGKWIRLEREFTTPPEMKQCQLDVGLYSGFLGEAWFDDVNVEISDRHFVYVTAPGNRSLFLDKPQMTVAAVRTGKAIEPGTMVKVMIRGKEFSAAAGEVIEKGQAKLSFSGLREGPADAVLSLLAPDGKTILAQEKFSVDIERSARGRRGSYIDGHGRLIVDGKPFMPLGFYIGQMSKEEIDQISRAGFNTLLSYGSMYLRFHYGKPGNPAALQKTLEVMDHCHSKKIKLVFSIANVWESGAYAVNNWYGTRGADNVARAAIDALSGHPALLAWYLYDEPPASMREKLNERRALVSRHDPHHVTFMVSMHFNELYNFASCSDIGGVDPYPIMNRAQDMYDVRHAGRQAAKLHKPFWGVVQIFNQAYYTDTTPENHHRVWHEIHRDPSEEEIRSMCFSLAQSGAKGFLFYYWHCIKDEQNRSRDPDYFRRNFAKMEKIARAMKTLQPYLLSTYAIQKLPLRSPQGKVEATMHRDENGRKCVLITAEGPGPARCVLELPGRYRSLFGKTVFKDGQYHFHAENIASDMLVQQ